MKRLSYSLYDFPIGFEKCGSRFLSCSPTWTLTPLPNTLPLCWSADEYNNDEDDNKSGSDESRQRHPCNNVHPGSLDLVWRGASQSSAGDAHSHALHREQSSASSHVSRRERTSVGSPPSPRPRLGDSHASRGSADVGDESRGCARGDEDAEEQGVGREECMSDAGSAHVKCEDGDAQSHGCHPHDLSASSYGPSVAWWGPWAPYALATPFAPAHGCTPGRRQSVCSSVGSGAASELYMSAYSLLVSSIVPKTII
jgi:hypothetical protein